jgi:hypothetical protein
MHLYPHSLPLRRTRPPYWAIQNPRARQVIETSGRASDERHTPAAQILIERRGAAEHEAHSGAAAREESVGIGTGAVGRWRDAAT